MLLKYASNPTGSTLLTYPPMENGRKITDNDFLSAISSRKIGLFLYFSLKSVPWGVINNDQWEGVNSLDNGFVLNGCDKPLSKSLLTQFSN